MMISSKTWVLNGLAAHAMKIRMGEVKLVTITSTGRFRYLREPSDAVAGYIWNKKNLSIMSGAKFKFTCSIDNLFTADKLTDS